MIVVVGVVATTVTVVSCNFRPVPQHQRRRYRERHRRCCVKSYFIIAITRA